MESSLQCLKRNSPFVFLPPHFYFFLPARGSFAGVRNRESSPEDPQDLEFSGLPLLLIMGCFLYLLYLYCPFCSLVCNIITLVPLAWESLTDTFHTLASVKWTLDRYLNNTAILCQAFGVSPKIIFSFKNVKYNPGRASLKVLWFDFINQICHELQMSRIVSQSWHCCIPSHETPKLVGVVHSLEGNRFFFLFLIVKMWTACCKMLSELDPFLSKKQAPLGGIFYRCCLTEYVETRFFITVHWSVKLKFPIGKNLSKWKIISRTQKNKPTRNSYHVGEVSECNIPRNSYVGPILNYFN